MAIPITDWPIALESVLPQLVCNHAVNEHFLNAECTYCLTIYLQMGFYHPILLLLLTLNIWTAESLWANYVCLQANYTAEYKSCLVPFVGSFNGLFCLLQCCRYELSIRTVAPIFTFGLVSLIEWLILSLGLMCVFLHHEQVVESSKAISNRTKTLFRTHVRVSKISGRALISLVSSKCVSYLAT